MIYYARPENAQGACEKVSQHLARCAKLAEKFGKSFGQEAEAREAALLHDLGKFSNKFQQVLKHEITGVNHAAAGAVYAHYGCGIQNQAVPIAIFGHHRGLDYYFEKECQDSMFEQGAFDKERKSYALNGEEEYSNAVEVFLQETGYTPAALPKPDFSVCSNKRIEEMLYIRMLFSCLVDSDYSSAAMHEDADYMTKSSGNTLEPEKILESLKSYREEIRKNSKSDKELNKIRDVLYNDCTESGKNLLPGLFTLTAPTGTGKTLALLSFAAEHAKQWGKERIIFVLPFLSIIEQNAAIYKKICGDIFEDHSLSQKNYTEYSRYYSERWQVPVLVTTSVKFFEALFKHKAPDCRKLHSIANSVIVFDEAQSLPEHLIGATLDSVNALCGTYNCSVVFSTATQPFFECRQDFAWKPVEIVKSPQELFDRCRRVSVEWRVKEKTPLDCIAQEMIQSESCCTIVNLKAHAGKLFSLLRDMGAEAVFYLSTNMCPGHRKDTITKIKNRIGQRLPCRVVSTQCIEAGVDLDFHKVFRALAPLDAIIQSAGRCNRNGSGELGRVVVFVPDEDRLYPGEYYQSAAERVKILLHEYEIDINNTAHIEEYYKKLFLKVDCDAKKLRDAIAGVDFEKVDQNYKLINNTGVNIIVPYAEEMDLFNHLNEELKVGGLTPKIMAEAAPITVSSYDVENVERLCEQLFFWDKKGIKHSSNWYILQQINLYDSDTGLNINADTQLNTVT